MKNIQAKVSEKTLIANIYISDAERTSSATHAR